jgi:hypothetical protein
LALIGDVGGHGRQPFQGIEDFFLPVVLGAVEDPGFFREISQAFLRERGPDNVPNQVLICMPAIIAKKELFYLYALMRIGPPSPL